MRLSIRVSSVTSSAASRRRSCPAMSRGRTVASSALAWAADRYFFAPPGMQLQQQPVQAVDRLRAGHAQLVTAVGQQPQRHRRVIGGDHPQARAVQPGQRHRMRIDRVGFAALASGEHPGPGGQLRGHIGHRLAVGDQALREVAADPIAALHRPGAVRELPPRGQHRPVTVPVSAEPALPNSTFPRPSMISIVAERLCGSIPMNHVPHAASPTPAMTPVTARRATLLRAGQTPLEPLPLPRQHPARARRIRATPPAWAAEFRATRRAPSRAAVLRDLIMDWLPAGRRVRWWNQRAGLGGGAASQPVQVVAEGLPGAGEQEPFDLGDGERDHAGVGGGRLVRAGPGAVPGCRCGRVTRAAVTAQMARAAMTSTVWRAIAV